MAQQDTVAGCVEAAAITKAATILMGYSGRGQLDRIDRAQRWIAAQPVPRRHLIWTCSSGCWREEERPTRNHASTLRRGPPSPFTALHTRWFTSSTPAFVKLFSRDDATGQRLHLHSPCHGLRTSLKPRLNHIHLHNNCCCCCNDK